MLGHPHPRRARGSEQRIGWAELVALPDLGLTGLRAKMDSGAATSALSAANVAMRQADDGSHWVDFTFCQAGGDAAVPCSARLVGHRVQQVDGCGEPPFGRHGSASSEAIGVASASSQYSMGPPARFSQKTRKPKRAAP